MTSVLRLGVYRERIEKYSGGNGSGNGDSMPSKKQLAQPQQPANSNGCNSNVQTQISSNSKRRSGDSHEDVLTVTIERQAGKHLGIRLTSNLEPKPGIFIADIQEGSAIALDGRLQKHDRILFINGQDVRDVDLSQASALIQVLPFFLISSSCSCTDSNPHLNWGHFSLEWKVICFQEALEMLFFVQLIFKRPLFMLQNISPLKSLEEEAWMHNTCMAFLFTEQR